MRQQNLSTNHHAASRDIAASYALLEQLRLISDGGGPDLEFVQHLKQAHLCHCVIITIQ